MAITSSTRNRWCVFLFVVALCFPKINTKTMCRLKICRESTVIVENRSEIHQFGENRSTKSCREQAFLDPLHQMRCKASDLVAQALRGNGCNLLGNLLVHLKIQRELRVVLLHNDTCGLLHSLCPDTSHDFEVCVLMTRGNGLRWELQPKRLEPKWLRITEIVHCKRY